MFDFQAYLDRVVDANRSGDFAAFEACLALPLAVMCLEGTAVMTTRDELRGSFEAYRLNLERLGVTDYVRTASALHVIGPGCAMGVYQTHLLRNGVRMVEPYSTSVTLREMGGGWRATSLATAVPGAAHWFRLPPFLEGEARPEGPRAPDPVAGGTLGDAMPPALGVVPGGAAPRGGS